MCTEPASLENLKVLYQSDDYIVLEKHWDIRIDSKMWYEKVTVQAQLRQHFPDLADPNTYYGFRFCHQLDFSTSGALCVALNKAAAGQAYHCFKDRTVTKLYIALLRGWVEAETQTLDFSIGKNSSEGKTHMMCIEGTEGRHIWLSLGCCIPYLILMYSGCENPKPCQTELKVLQYGLYDGEPATKVLLKPLTGRTHQLRVHCSAIGHPIVGDFTYSLGSDDAPYRMMLHAYLLRIPLEPQPLLVSTEDPFTPTRDPKWQPERSIRTLEDTVDVVLDRRLEEERAIEKEKQHALQEKNKKCAWKKQKDAEADGCKEQTKQCQEWLSEWGEN